LQEAELINVYVEPDFLRQSVQSDLRGIVLGEFQTIARKDDQIRDVALRLRKHCLEFGSDDPLYFSLSGLSLAVRLLKVHLNGARYVTEPRGTLPIASRDRVIDYMRQHLGEKFDLMRLSAIAGFSPQHFVRLFKREFGVTPHDYVLDLRLLKAHQLLREGGRNVSEVAMATGFFDQSHLDRYFRRKFSCTPKSVMKGRP
jgi:AraC family transcriptional regulator